MAPVGLGWAIGDIIAVTKTLYDLSKGFRSASGAQADFSRTAAWLESFGHDLQRVYEFKSRNPQAACTPGLDEKLLLIRSQYEKFERYLEEFGLFKPQQSAPQGSSRRKAWQQARKAASMLKWTWEKMEGHVENLRLQVSMPLAEMNLILVLEVW